MSVDSWQEVKQILAAALERDPQERSAYVAAACSGNPAQLQEVQSLLDAYQKGESWLEQSAPADPALHPGDKLDVYVIEELIGAGGMGQVYRALDTSLRCRFAIKVLPPIFSPSPERLARFEREAQSAAALNHPNILSIHRLGTNDGILYIVSELLTGQNLRATLKDGVLSPDTVVNYALQIASGLAAAHDKGIIHRDVKPENLFVTEYKQIKILDFGLAKSEAIRAAASQATISPRHPTKPGTALGTIAYMSPEQARGEMIGSQTDIFSFGIVLYEISTGASPFPGETAAIVSEAILNRAPIPPSRLNPAIGPALEAIILRALEKNVEHRYRHAREMHSDLERLKGDADTVTIRRSTRSRTRNSRLQILGIVAAVAIVLVSIGYFLSRGHSRLSEKDTMVIADFVNTTGDSVFDGALRQGLSAQLGQSPFLNLLSDDRIAETLALMGQAKGVHLFHELAREVCQRTDSAATIEGSISNLGSQYVLGLKAVDCRSGDVLAEDQVTAAGKERVLDALGQSATKLRGKLGEQLATLQKFNKPLEQVTTSSLDALKAYSLGCDAVDIQADPPASVPLFLRAINLDPDFAMAYARLATDYGNLEEPSLAADNARKAYELRERVSAREKFYIASHYDDFVTGNLEAARRTYELWHETYPRDAIAPENLGVIYGLIGAYDKNLAMTLEAKKLDGGSGLNYGNLVNAYLLLNRLPEAKAEALKAQENHLDSPTIHLSLYQVAFLSHDTDGMGREAAVIMNERGYESLILDLESNTAAWSGHFAKARELTAHAVEAARRNDEKEATSQYEAEAALREALTGNSMLARRDAETALANSSGKDAVAMTAISLGLTGDSDQAMRLAADLAKRYPEDTIVQSVYLPMVRASAESGVNRSKSLHAIELLRAAETYELGLPSINFSLYPAYLRGEAYLAVRQGGAAALEFEKIVDHPGEVVNEPIAALAHLGIARAYSVTGDKSAAKAAYRNFLDLWKDADPDIPLLKEAKVEYERL